MKAKRFLGILLAVLMMLSCFAVSASADETYTLNIYLYETNDSGLIGLRTDTNMANSNLPEGVTTPVVGVNFKMYKVADDATSTTAPTGVTPAEQATNGDGVAIFTVTEKGRYLVVPDDTNKPEYASGAYIVPFLVDLPRTNDAGTAKENTVNVYPKMLVTGAIQLTKTFNGAAPTGDESAEFKVTSPNGFEETVVLNAANGGVWQKDGLAFGEYTAVEQNVTEPYVVNATEIKFNVTKGGAFTDTNEDGYVGTVVTGELDNKSSTKPSVSKEVKSSTGTTYRDKANIDSYNSAVADWRITTVLPSDITSYKSFVLTDTVDSKLVFDNNTDVSVKLGGVAMSTELYDLSINGRTITVTLKNFADQTPNGTLTVEFSTAIDTTKDENIGVQIPNHVELEYTNASDESGTVDNNTPENPVNPENPEDPDDPGRRPDPVVWTGEIDILKIGENDAALSDVEFTLTTSNGTTLKPEDQTLKTDAEGKITLTGLLDGTYTLTETKAKDGYELIGVPITIVVENGKVTSATGSTLATLVNELITVKNIPSTNLPLTGGMGTALFAGLGLALAVVGGVLFFKKSKKAKAC